MNSVYLGKGRSEEMLNAFAARERSANRFPAYENHSVGFARKYPIQVIDDFSALPCALSLFLHLSHETSKGTNL